MAASSSAFLKEEKTRVFAASKLSNSTIQVNGNFVNPKVALVCFTNLQAKMPIYEILFLRRFTPLLVFQMLHVCGCTSNIICKKV
ncbi:MAG: hypothetical protein ICV53_17850 [Flavisolibacter sp.]|nr:hypothetical protein [Flavisolibacter sp.]